MKIIFMKTKTNGGWQTGIDHRPNTVKEGRKDMFYLKTHSTHFIYSYMALDMVKDHSDSKRENLLLSRATLSN